MLATSLALIAYIASANVPSALSYQTDYAKAYAKAVDLHRPMAVFIGDGKDGLAKVVKDGVSEASSKVLAQSFVCVYIDSSSETGKKLAASFEMSQGLVISDRSGDKQALRLTGTVPASDLAESLTKFSDPNVVVTTTATTLHPVPVYVAPARSGCASGNCPFAR